VAGAELGAGAGTERTGPISIGADGMDVGHMDVKQKALCRPLIHQIFAKRANQAVDDSLRPFAVSCHRRISNQLSRERGMRFPDVMRTCVLLI
jgi:hypothetical protein